MAATPIAVAFPAGPVTPDHPIVLLANEVVVTNLPFVPWRTMPAVAGAPPMVSITFAQAARCFISRCRTGTTPADEAAARLATIFRIRFQLMFWARLLTELRDSGLFAASISSIQRLDAKRRALTISNPFNLLVVAADWQLTPDFVIPVGAGAAAAASRAIMQPMRYLSLVSALSLQGEEPEPWQRLSDLLCYLGGVLHDSTVDGVRARAVAAHLDRMRLPVALRSLSLEEDALGQELSDGITFRSSVTSRENILEQRVHCLGGCCETLKLYVLDRESDAQAAYALVKQLNANLLSEEQRSLGVLTTLDLLESSLNDRRAALNQFAGKPAATATTIVHDLIGELASTRHRPGSTGAPTPAGVPPSALGGPLSDEAFDDATNKSMVFMNLTSGLATLDRTTKQGRIDSIALGFDGMCVIAVRTLLSTTGSGDSEARKHATLLELNSLRSVRHDYFNYMLTVDAATGTIPHRLLEYKFATGSSTNDGGMQLMIAFLNRHYSTMDWISAPHGLNGYLRYLDNKSVAASCHPADHYCQPVLMRKLGKFGHRLFNSIGTATTADPAQGFTFESLCERYSQHLEVATQMPNVAAQVSWLTAATVLFGEILDDIATWINLVLAAPNVAAQSLSNRPLVRLTDTAVAKMIAKEAKRDSINEMSAQLGLSASSSSTEHGHFNSYQLPLLSNHLHGKSTGKSKTTITGLKRPLPEEPPTAQGLPPGSNTNMAKWSADKKFIAVSGLVWNIAALAAHLNVAVGSVCWEYLLAKVQEQNRPSRCPAWGKPGHKSPTDSAHVIPGYPNGLDIDALASRFARPLNDQERAALQTAAAEKGKGPKGKGSRGASKGKGFGRGKGRGRAARGRGRGLPGRSGQLALEDNLTGGENDLDQLDGAAVANDAPSSVSIFGSSAASAPPLASPLLAVLDSPSVTSGAGSLVIQSLFVGDTLSSLVRPSLPIERATPLSLLPPPLRTLALSLKPTKIVIDVGGGGQCGPNTFSFLLGLAGHDELDGPTLRAEVVSHIQQPGVLERLTSVLAANSEQPLTLKCLIEECFSHWPADARQGKEPSVEAWSEATRQPATWTDLAFMQIVADRYAAAIRLHGVNDLSELQNLGVVGPCDGAPPQIVLEAGCWVGRHLVAVVDVSMSGASQPQLLNTGGRDDEALPLRRTNHLTFPIRSVNEFKQLLSCEDAPTYLVGFEFSGAVRSQLEAQGKIAISVDLRECDIGGMHAVLDVRLVANLRYWDGAFFFPPCFQQLRHDHDCLHLKIADGRAFWGCAVVGWCICFCYALFVIVEQADTIVYDYVEWHAWGLYVLFFRTPMYGDERDKSVRLFSNNAVLPPFVCARQPPKKQPNRSQFNFADEDARDRDRSSWATLPHTAHAVASAVPKSLQPHVINYLDWMAEFAHKWYEAHGVVPLGYLAPDARPPTESARSYQQRCGPGDGRPIECVVVVGDADLSGADAHQLSSGGRSLQSWPEKASLVMDGLLCSHALVDPCLFATAGYDSESTSDDLATEPSRPPSPQQGLEEEGRSQDGNQAFSAASLVESSFDIPADYCVDMTAAIGELQCMAVLIYVCVIAQPLVLAHVNGFTITGLQVPAASRPHIMGLVGRLCTMITGLAQLAFMIGEYSAHRRLFASPVDMCPAPSTVCRTPEQRREAERQGASFVWCTMAALAGTPVLDVARRALVGTRMFIQPVEHLPDHPEEGAPSFKFGVTRARSLVSRARISSSPARATLAKLGVAASLLSLALLTAVAAGDVLLTGWAEQIKPLDVDMVPPSLLDNLPDFADARLDHVLLSPVYEPIITSWSPNPPTQPSPDPTEPVCIHSWRDICLPEARDKVQRWLDEAHADMLSIDAQLARGVPPSMIVRSRPDPIAISGLTEVQPWAVGKVYDCTKRQSHCCVVADYGEAVQSHLDLDYLRQRLGSYPDRALVSYMIDGVRLEADVELQTVFVPHLASVPLGWDSVHRELARKHKLGWYDVYSDLPFFPCYLLGKGAATRKLELDRYRETTEGGGPRTPTFDASGLPAISLNEAARSYHFPRYFELERARNPSFALWLRERGLPRPPEPAEPVRPSSFSKWPKERKPQLDQVMRDTAIFNRAGHVISTAVYGFGDDFKDYFMQYAMSPSQLWKQNHVFLGEASAGPGSQRPLIFVSERQLGFGTHPASNIAQRGGEAVLALFREDMDVAEEEARRQADAESTAEAPWLQARLDLQRREGIPCVDIFQHTRPASLSLPPIPAPLLVADIPTGYVCPQLRLYSVYIFTDDPQFITVGVSRSLRALRCWRQLIFRLRFIMAIEEKRSLGTWCLWLGVVLVLGLGIAVVPKSKILRARASISDTLHGITPFHAYRSLCGLLEHLRAINLSGRNVMHGLYRPHAAQSSADSGPGTLVVCDALMIKQLHRWLELLLISCGVSCTCALFRYEIEVAPRLFVEASSDACYSDVERPGVAGFCHGLYWLFLIPMLDVPFLSIPILEFLGVVGNVLIFHSYFRATVARHRRDGAVQVLLRTDALTSSITLPAESMSSPLIVEAYQCLRARPEFQDLRWVLAAAHLFGDGNPFSDTLSRQKFQEFQCLCRQCGITPKQVEIPESFLELYAHVRDVARSLPTHPVGSQSQAADSSSEAVAPVGAGSSPSSSSPKPFGYFRVGADSSSRSNEGSQGYELAEFPLTLGVLVAAKMLAAAASNIQRSFRPRGSPQPTSHPFSTFRFGCSGGAALARLRGVSPAYSPNQPSCAQAFSAEGAALRKLQGGSSLASPVAACQSPKTTVPRSPPPAASTITASAADETNTSHTVRSMLRPGALLATPSARSVGGILFPPALPLVRPPSRLTQAGEEFARQRAMRLRQGEPGMAITLRAEQLTAITAAMEQYSSQSIPPGTAQKDDFAWQLWEYVCAEFGTSPLRSAQDVRDYPERISLLLAVTMLHGFSVAKPKARARKFIKPNSALAYPLAIIRIFGRWGIALPCYKPLKAQVVALVQLFQEYHGPLSLSPKRVEPMKFSMVRRINAIENGAQVSSIRWAHDDHHVFMFRRLNRVMIYTAFRLGEICGQRPASGPSRASTAKIHYLTYSSLSFRLDGVWHPRLTRDQIFAFRVGRDQVAISVPLSKPDQSGEIHCPFPIYFTYENADINAAGALLDLELRFGLHLSNEERATRALFHDPAGQPYGHHFLHNMLRIVLTYLYGAAVAAVFSFHSYRAGLATALHAANVDDDMIQLICRWMCPESLHRYRVVGVREHERYINSASNLNVDSIQASNVPKVAGNEGFALLLSELHADNSPAAWQTEREFAAAAQNEEPARSTNCPKRHLPATTHADADVPLVPCPKRHLPATTHVDTDVPLVPATNLHTGDSVLAAASAWPKVICTEFNGSGWAVTIQRVTKYAARVSFDNARTENNRPYEDVVVPNCHLYERPSPA